MKKTIFSILVLTLGIATTVQAGPAVVCKKSTEASSQGLEVVIKGGKARLLSQGLEIAVMKALPTKKVYGADQMTMVNFIQNEVNGYAVRYVSGGFAGTRKATVQRGGFAGFTTVAVLNDCR